MDCGCTLLDALNRYMQADIAQITVTKADV